MHALDYVNIRQGTHSNNRFSCGNTLPLTQLPFAMAGFAPQTNGAAQPWFYHPDDHSLEGVRLTHQPSPWLGDYGALLLMPQSGTPGASAGERWSGYRPQDAELRPDYMRLRFLRAAADFELAPTERGGVLRLTFGREEPAFLSVLPVGGTFACRLEAEAQRVVGYTDYHNLDKAENFRMYFVLQFEDGACNPSRTQTLPDGGMHVALNGRKAQAQIAISYISEEQALRNLAQDRAGSFDAARQAAARQWGKRLSSIRVETETEEQLRTFYSCLYRVFLYPHKAYELDEHGEAQHYCPGDGAVRPGVRYTDNGFWDTYRTVYPLFSIIAPEDYAEMLDGFVQDYRDYGWLPRWPSIGEIGCMPSTLIDAVIADAAVKGIASRELLETALKGMLHHATTDAPEKRFGRNGATAYRKYGYVPRDLEKESVNLTLDAAYGDFCIAQTAQVLGYADIENEYRPLAKNYKNIFDPATGFMRGRDTNGEMAPDFNPCRWGGEYTEGSAWQNSFAVPHDVEGLAELYGGREKLLARLDELFAMPPDYLVGGYGTEIHEMTEMAAADFGQCAISNQPSFHLPYLYAALGEPDKAAYWVEKMCREAFSYREDGFPGDEDNGTMSAWYIFSCLGFYPLCPGKPEYVVTGKLLVKQAWINGSPWDPAGRGVRLPHSVFNEA